MGFSLDSERDEEFQFYLLFLPLGSFLPYGMRFLVKMTLFM